MAVKTRFLIISDTHGEAVSGIHNIPVADVAIHCGDLTEESHFQEFRKTLDLLRSIKAPLKLVIAGNHDFTMDTPTFEKKISESEALDPELVRKFYGDYDEARQLFEDARADGIVLLNEGTHSFNLDNGAAMTVYASPFTPSLNGGGFQYHPEQGHNFTITEGVDVVITHGPPRGIMDYTDQNRRAGCSKLFAAVARARPRLHCFGHIHEGWGAKLAIWREQISETPSHFTDIYHSKSVIVKTLSDLEQSLVNSPEIERNKMQEKSRFHQQGYIGTSHCTGDQAPLQAGSQTLFVNAAIEGVTEEYPRHLPWLVDIELPLASKN
ncbi:Metallo-dependent phosphatase [Hypoxylon sp. FL0890]|nr:Metallo-dependent phosphatase [Hypoxylon sp. FL0890]